MIRPLPRNIGFALWGAAFLVWRGGLNLFTVASLFVMLGLGVALYWVETRTVRPRRTYYLFGLGSVLLFFPLVAVAPPGASMLLGALIWAGIALLVGIWVVYYEASEPIR